MRHFLTLLAALFISGLSAGSVRADAVLSGPGCVIDGNTLQGITQKFALIGAGAIEFRTKDVGEIRHQAKMLDDSRGVYTRFTGRQVHDNTCALELFQQ